VSDIKFYPRGEPGVIDLGDGQFLLPTTGAPEFLWWHRCPKRAAWRQIGGTTSGHKVTSHDPVTIQGSLLCTDCGAHGFVEDGRWRKA